MALRKKNEKDAGQEASPEKKPKREKRKKTPEKAPSKPSARGKKFIFIVGDEGGILVFMQGAKVVRRLFAPSAQPSHTEAMLELLSANPTAPVYLLADVLDQQYVPQTFPPVSSMSVMGLVKRRMERDFQPDDLKNALPLGRDKMGRKEWKFLLISLAKTPLMVEWFALLFDLPNEFKGVYLVPVEAIGYIAALNKRLPAGTAKPWQMFISHNKISGFRQVVVNDGKLIFTRVSQAIDDAVAAVIAGNIEQEVINTLEYLKRLDFKEDGQLDVTVVVAQEVADSLDLKRFGFAGIHVMTPLAVSEALGLEQAALSADRFGDVVMAAAFGVAKKHRLRFSTAYIDRISKIYQARIGVKAAMLLALLACAGLSLMSVSRIVDSYSATSQAQSATTAMQPDLEKMQKRVAGLNQDVAFKSAVVTSYDAYIKDVQLPEKVLAPIVPLVTPQQRITGFVWQYNDPTVKREGATAAGTGIELKLDIDFSGTGGNAELLSKAADAMLAAMQEALKEYDVISDPYPWVDAQPKQVTLDLTEAVVPAEKRVVSFKIAWPKKGGAK